MPRLDTKEDKLTIMARISCFPPASVVRKTPKRNNLCSLPLVFLITVVVAFVALRCHNHNADELELKKAGAVIRTCMNADPRSCAFVEFPPMGKSAE